MKIERDKFYKTRNGDKRRVICTDAGSERPVISVNVLGGPVAHCADGGVWGNAVHDYDLMEEWFEPRVVYANFWAPHGGPAGCFATAAGARAAADKYNKEAFSGIAVKLAEVKE